MNNHKSTMTIETADGKREIVEGIEPLDKQPTEEAQAQNAYQVADADATEEEKRKKKKLKKSDIEARWELLKAELDHNISIMSMDEDQSQDNEDQSGQPNLKGMLDEVGVSHDDPESIDTDSEYEDEHHEHIHGILDSILSGDADEQDPEVQQVEDMNPEELTQLMEELGYNPQEIAYVLHGHDIPMESSEVADQAHNKREADEDFEHKKKMNEIERNRAQAESSAAAPELDVEHKKEMLAIEREFARKHKELELENKKKEAEMKLKFKQQQLQSRQEEKE